MPKLTQLAVERMRPDPARRIEVSDQLMPQLRLVIQPSGARSWAIRTRINGRSVKLTLGDARALDLAKARAVARAALTEIAKGEDPRARKQRARATTLDAVAELYLRDRAAETRAKTRTERERHLRRDWKPLHHRPLESITRRQIAERLVELKDGHGPIAANRSRSTLHQLYAWALARDLVEGNPVAATKPPARRELGRDRVLSLQELRALWAATERGSDYDAIVRLLILSGQRREEVAGMRWEELDVPCGRWLIPGERTKNRRPHLVMLSRQMVKILEAKGREDGRELVFGKGEGGFSGWSRSKRRLDLRCPMTQSWTLHDLRRSFVTHLVEMGIAPAVVEAVVNHTSGVKGGVAGIYNRAEHLPERARVMQLWADHLLSASESSGKVVAFAAAAG